VCHLDRLLASLRCRLRVCKVLAFLSLLGTLLMLALVLGTIRGGTTLMEPQEYEDLTRNLAEIYWKNLQVIAEQDPTLTRLQWVLEQDRSIQQMDLQGLRDFCDALEARYAAAVGRGA
jgi:hypothetical protein